MQQRDRRSLTLKCTRNVPEEQLFCTPKAPSKTSVGTGRGRANPERRRRLLRRACGPGPGAGFQRQERDGSCAVKAGQWGPQKLCCSGAETPFGPLA